MRLKKHIIFLPILLLVGFSKYSSEPVAAAPTGEDYYKTYCKSCHGRKGNGFFKLYPPLSDKKYLNNDSLMVAIITQGISGPITVSGKEYNQEMPAVKDISSAQIAAVVNYIRQEFVESSKKISEDEVVRWRKVLGS